MTTKLYNITDLIPDPANVRKHSPKNIAAIKGSLARFGQQKPIIIDKNNVVRAGNGTLEAAKQLGWTQIEARLTNLEGTELTAFAIADNRTAELAEWDVDGLNLVLKDLHEQEFDFDAIGFDETDLGDILGKDKGTEGNTDQDDVPEIEENIFCVKRGDIWILGNHRIMCGDSTNENDVTLLMDGQKADMVFTDPPYGVSYVDKNKFLNAISRGNLIQKPIENDHGSVNDMYDLWCKIFNIICEFSTDKCSYYICSPQGGEFMMMMMQAIYQSPFSLKHTIIWVKNNHVLGRCDYNYKHEPILFGWKKNGTHEFFGKGKFKTSVWEIAKPLKNDLHPTMKPVELVIEAIENSCIENGKLIEPFCGSGSTLIACEKTGRRCFGMEIDPHYCSVIIKRWQDFTGKQVAKIG